MESLVMRKAVGKSKTSWRDNPSAYEAQFGVNRTPDQVDHLDGAANRPTDRSSPDGSHFFNGEPHMRNRLQVSLWGLRLDAEGILAIAVAFAIVLVFALLLALRF
jgi:hypothetical protein